MTVYLPSVLPDELLYSLLARTAAHRGVRSAAGFMSELFGRPQVISSFDLPGNLRIFTNGAGLSVDHIIDGMTLFPFFTAFVAPALRDEARARMSGSMVGVHNRLGVTTFRIPPLRALRFCPTCTREWDRAGSEWYWRRSHQMPGVLICPDHGTWLRPSRVSLDNGDRHRFVAASAENCPLSEKTLDLDVVAQAQLLKLARAAQSLLDHPRWAGEPEQPVDDYRERLADVGLMRSACKIDPIALEERFLSFWGNSLTHLPRVITGGAPTGGWLQALVRSRRRGAHPVCHLLLMLFLDSLSTVKRPFGDGPWRCRNPLSAHHGELVVQEVVVRRHRENRYGDFLCGCGYAYTCALDPSGEIGRPRFRTYGPTLQPVLLQMLAAGRSLRSIGEHVGLDPKTVAREAAALGIDAPWARSVSSAPQAVEVQTRPEGRARPRVARRRPLLDWSAIDQRLALATETAVASILAESPAKRVAMAEIERRIASRGWVLKRRKKLPRTVGRMTEALESLADFRLRRLAQSLRRTAGRVDRTPSDVLRECGLPMAWLSKVREAMQNDIQTAQPT